MEIKRNCQWQATGVKRQMHQIQSWQQRPDLGPGALRKIHFYRQVALYSQQTEIKSTKSIQKRAKSMESWLGKANVGEEKVLAEKHFIWRNCWLIGDSANIMRSSYHCQCAWPLIPHSWSLNPPSAAHPHDPLPPSYRWVFLAIAKSSAVVTPQTTINFNERHSLKKKTLQRENHNTTVKSSGALCVLCVCV